MIGLLSSPSAVAAADEAAARRASPLEPAKPDAAPIDAVHSVEPVAGAETAGAHHDHRNELTTDERLRQEEALRGRPDAESGTSDAALSEEEEKEVRSLQARDAEVRRHEQAHAAAGGSLAGAPQYEFERGPDGQRYAVGGEVSIDSSREPDPDATIEKMRQVRRAALAPSDPSSQDRSVAAKAARVIRAAEAELAARRNETLRDTAAEIVEIRDKSIVDAREQAAADDQGTSGSVAPPAASHRVSEYQRHAVISSGTRIGSVPPPAAGNGFDSTV